jgi:membrane-bound serine protease (ClpP class)
MFDIVVAVGLVVLALGLLVGEDLLPTGGMLAMCAGCILLFVLFMGFTESVTVGFVCFAFEILFVPFGFAAWTALVANTRLGRAGFLRPPEAHEVDSSSGRPDLALVVGLEGRALSTLRPSGMVEFDGLRLDGVAEEGMIQPGSPILAVRVRSGRLIVRPSPEARPEATC